MIVLIPDKITLDRRYYLDQRTMQPFLKKGGKLIDHAPPDIVEMYTELMEEIANYDERAFY